MDHEPRPDEAQADQPVPEADPAPIPGVPPVRPAEPDPAAYYPLATLKAMTRQALIRLARARWPEIPGANWVPNTTHSDLVEALHTNELPPPLLARLTGTMPAAAPAASHTPGSAPAAAPAGDTDPAANRLLTALRYEIQQATRGAAVDENQVRRIVLEELGHVVAPRTMQIHQSARKPVTITQAHKALPDVLAIAAAIFDGAIRDGIWLHGPAGTGKSHMEKQVATAFDAEFHFLSMCATTSEAALKGYQDAAGVYHPTPVYRAWKAAAEGRRAVLAIDEMDNGSPSILPVLNTALGNGWLTFPNGESISITRDLVVIASANTIGEGATETHIGRSKQDKATLDRFCFVRVDIDEDLEKALAFARDPKLGPYWSSRVQAWRKGVEACGVRHILSPRATYGAIAVTQAAIRCGIPRSKAIALAERARVWQALPDDVIQKIKNASPKINAAAGTPETTDTDEGETDGNA